MRTLILLAAALIAHAASAPVWAQHAGRVRLPPEVLDVVSPVALVRGAPGAMTVVSRPCRTLSTSAARRRVVDIAVQEWGFFGFPIAHPDDDDWAGGGGVASLASGSSPDERRGRRLSRLGPEEAARVAASIAGYWAVTSEGSWIVARQNEAWRGPDGTAVRWNAPWSAAFVSWVMCEAGFGSVEEFQRAIAHHTYIDQAIRARDGREPQSAFVAYDVGESVIGRVICCVFAPPRLSHDCRASASDGSRREEPLRRGRQAGRGARTHPRSWRQRTRSGQPQAAAARCGAGQGSATGRHAADARPIFAHLKLQADPIEANALDSSPTIKAFGCQTRLSAGGSGSISLC